MVPFTQSKPEGVNRARSILLVRKANPCKSVVPKKLVVTLVPAFPNKPQPLPSCQMGPATPCVKTCPVSPAAKVVKVPKSSAPTSRVSIPASGSSRRLPATCNFSKGVIVPMPTFCPANFRLPKRNIAERKQKACFRVGARIVHKSWSDFMDTTFRVYAQVSKTAFVFGQYEFVFGDRRATSTIIGKTSDQLQTRIHRLQITPFSGSIVGRTLSQILKI